MQLRTYVQNVFDYHRQSILDVLGHQYNDWDQPQFHSEEFPRPSNIFRDHMVDLLGDAQVIMERWEKLDGPMEGWTDVESGKIVKLNLFAEEKRVINKSNWGDEWVKLN